MNNHSAWKGMMSSYIYYVEELNQKHFTFFLSCRTTICQYSRIGCSWRGPYHEHEEHERSCTHLHNSGLTWTQVLNVLNAMEKEKNEEKNLYGIIFDLLSYEKFSFSGKCSTRIIYNSENRILSSN